MASESIGAIYPTQIPGYADNADIQAAFRLYHYGSSSYNTANANTANLIEPSIAHTLNYLQTQVTNLSGGDSVAKSIIDAKGDLIIGSANDAVDNLAVGSNDFVLTADSAQTLGVKWAAPSVGLSNSVTLTNKTVALGSNTVSGTIAQFNTAVTDADFATLAGTETITNKTLKSPQEFMTISATAATGTVNFDIVTQSILYYTTNASANFTLNFRGDSGTTLNSLMAIGNSITLVFMNTNGATPYYPTAITIDGNAVTPKIQGGTAITSGNASSIDSYSVTIIKTANATFTVLEAQTKFA
jgi:hypothetical protein